MADTNNVERDDLVARVAVWAGESDDRISKAELAELLGVPAEDRTFQRALREALEQGVIVATGSTSDRTFSRPLSRDEEIAERLLARVPCTARELSTVMDELMVKFDLDPAWMGRFKCAIGIETFKGENGRWHCRYVEGYEADGRVHFVSQAARAEAFAQMAGRVGAQTIGAGKVPGKE